ncbi:MAG: hypothetical protein WC915_00245 [archaeon]|jgi:hypothetical protein
MNKKGQFFSPDLIIAVLIFLTILFFFFNASDAIFSRVDLSENLTAADEVSHNTMNILIYSPGVPFNWETKNFSQISLFGLAIQKNVIDEAKLVKLISFLDNDDEYLLIKEKMGLGKNEFKLELVNYDGNVLYSSNHVFGASKYKLSYERIVLFNGQQAILRGTIADEK